MTKELQSAKSQVLPLLKEKLASTNFFRINDFTDDEAVSQQLDGCGSYLDCCDVLEVPKPDKEGVCLITLREGRFQRQFEKINGLICLSFHYNPRASEYLKVTERAKWDRGEKHWDMPLEIFSDPTFWTEECLIGFFRCFDHVVIPFLQCSFEQMHDEQMKEQLQMKRRAEQAMEQFIHPLTKPVTLDYASVLRVVESIRPSDTIRRLYLHNGEEFEPFKPDQCVITPVEMVLVRVSVDEGKPRYYLIFIEETDHGKIELDHVDPPAFHDSKAQRSLLFIYSENIEFLGLHKDSIRLIKDGA